MKIFSIAKLAFLGLILGSLNLCAATKDLDQRCLFDFLNGTQKAATKTSDVILRVDDSLIVEELESKSGKYGHDDDWGYCPKRRIKAFEMCAHNMHAKNLSTDHAKIKELCVKKEKAEKLWTDLLVTDALFAEKAKTDKLWAGQACAYMLCAHKGNIKELLSDLLYTDSLKAEWADLDKISACEIDTKKLCSHKANIDHLTTKTLCASCDSNLKNLEWSTKYKLYAKLGVNQPGYTLGTPITYDTILEDPNNNFTDHTNYIAPVSGFYVYAIGMDLSNLTGTQTITGIPVNHPELWINGTEAFEAHNAFLASAPIQHVHFAGLVYLQAGDKVSVAHHVRYVDPILGDMYYNGNVDLIGSDNTYKSNLTFFMMHYLSSDSICCHPCHLDCDHFDVEKPCVPPCCPCEMHKPPCEVDCHEGHCGDHDDHGHHDEDHGGDHHGHHGDHDDWDMDDDNG